MTSSNSECQLHISNVQVGIIGIHVKYHVTLLHTDPYLPLPVYPFYMVSRRVNLGKNLTGLFIKFI